jgi:SAM-dependent methyltransferase
MSNDLQRSRWEAAHAQPRYRPRYPHEQVVRWTFRNLDRGAATKARVLDLGCGAGRHALFFASEGFESFACDISARGLREVQQLAKDRGVIVATHQTSGHDLSYYNDDMFDAVVSFGVLYYMWQQDAEQTLREALRVLKPGGKIFCVIRTDRDSRRIGATPIGGPAWRIGALTPDAACDMEAGMDMLFFSRVEAKALFSAFSNVEIDEMIYVHNDFSDDDWVITASKPSDTS